MNQQIAPRSGQPSTLALLARDLDDRAMRVPGAVAGTALLPVSGSHLLLIAPPAAPPDEDDDGEDEDDEDEEGEDKIEDEDDEQEAEEQAEVPAETEAAPASWMPLLPPLRPVIRQMIEAIAVHPYRRQSWIGSEWIEETRIGRGRGSELSRS